MLLRIAAFSISEGIVEVKRAIFFSREPFSIFVANQTTHISRNVTEVLGTFQIVSHVKDNSE